MTYRRIIIALCVLGISLPAMAQSRGRPGARPDSPNRNVRGGRPQQRPSDETIKLISLKFADPMETAKSLERVLGVRVVAEERTNSLIVMADPETLKLVEDLVHDIDIDRPEIIGEDQLVELQIRNRNVRDVVSQLAQLFRSELTLSADEQGRRILMRGNKKAIESAKHVASTLDVPLPTANVEVAFFQVGSSDDDFSQQTPDDLKSVTQQLQRFGTPRLVGRMTTSAVEGQKFRLNGQIAERTYLALEGRLEAAPTDGAVRLDIDANLSMNRQVDTDAKGRHVESPRFTVSTTVITKRGDYVVLGSAPLGWKPGESAVLVLHIPEEAN